jgi:hypothetical protein
MKGQPGPSGVVAAGGVDEEDIGTNTERSNRGGEHGALPEREKSGTVRSAGLARHHYVSDELTGDHDGCSDQGSIAGPARTGLAGPVGDEAPAHRRIAPSGMPQRRVERGKPFLLGR